MTIPLLFEDKFLLVIDKPAGVIVNRTETSGPPAGGETIQEWVEKKLEVPQVSQVPKVPQGKDYGHFLARGTRGTRATCDTFALRAGIVHRLDKETSGCLIIAKTPEAFVELQRQFKEREVEKEYLALVHGRVEPKEGTIRVPLARSRDDRQKFAVVPGGRAAETRYEVLGYFGSSEIVLSRVARQHHSNISAHTSSSLSDRPIQVSNVLLRDTSTGDQFPRKTISSLPARFTLLRLFPKTGRTHQIRVHMKYFGHPIVSDDTYAGEDRAREDRIWCPRMFLHAARIRFTHPETKKKVNISAPIPGNLQRVLTEFF